MAWKPVPRRVASWRMVLTSVVAHPLFFSNIQLRRILGNFGRGNSAIPWRMYPLRGAIDGYTPLRLQS